ncbi:HAD-IC family P-type ATPase [Thorsellia anophelis]|uniref:Plasma-membrane calcium-translocating P-type ATPase n=1 Tax=Thorsellia anophelis DSM 18579 TaxID=1123402 RepID=A0A1I0AUR2_9GAMM|nr:HAD-IC family P-type ATPase [Thorsellia anophelis]SES97944.1 plasma-membrane calcium-translocating P-type ATPase [Thorsellia anophelis DSM 18579]
MTKWYQFSLDDLYSKAKSNQSGLSQAERDTRLQTNGPNLLTKGKQETEFQKFIKHFNDLLIYVLIASGILKGAIGAYTEMIIIFLVVVINAIIGYIQERKANNSLNSLTNMMSEDATILVNSEKVVVDASTLVVGDIVLLSPGNIVPADIRIIEAYNLVVEEAILTGESVPIEKNNVPIEGDADLGDRINLAFSGTLVNSGSGKGVVVETGDRTELGKISQSLKSVDQTVTPLIQKMKLLNKQIFGILAILIAFLLVFSLMFRDFSSTELVSAMIALAVSAVPEGLPAVLSIILAMGVGRMAYEKAIIKKMPAVETLGSMSVICSDKTGTLTKNEMSVVSVITKETVYTELAAPIKWEESSIGMQRLLEIGLYCNDTKIDYHNGKREVIGNPTEAALLELSYKANLSQDNHTLYKIPFDSAYKYMATLVDINDRRFIYLKGAPDVLLSMMQLELQGDASTALDLQYWDDKIVEYAKKGQRVLAAAFKEVSNDTESFTHDDLSNDMVFAGLYGIIDPPKAEAIEAVGIARSAGISVKMITGDHKETAIAIAKEIGIEHYDKALVGKELEEMTDEELRDVVLTHDVFARTTPEHKLRLVSAIQDHGLIAAMTGDGVNDAAALKKADIGVAMGIKGTQVTKDTADMVLADDNFATIVKAVKEGRRVYDNLQKAIFFALPTAFSQGLLVVISILAGIELPLTPVQILWLNMVTTITLSFALGYEPYAEDIMQRKPRDPKVNILNTYAIIRVTYVSFIIGLLGFLIGGILRNAGAELATIQTTILQTLVFAQAFYMICCREITKFSITPTIKENNVLWYSLGILLVLQIAIIYLPFINTVMETAPLGFKELGISFLAGLSIFVIVEAEKFFYRKFKKA